MVVMVLSKFCTFTVVSVTSFTKPLAPCRSIVIQSPGRSMSLAVSCTPATRPRIVSLKTRAMTAAEAPSPATMVVRLVSMIMLTTMMIPTRIVMSVAIW